MQNSKSKIQKGDKLGLEKQKNSYHSCVKRKNQLDVTYFII